MFFFIYFQFLGIFGLMQSSAASDVSWCRRTRSALRDVVVPHFELLPFPLDVENSDIVDADCQSNVLGVLYSNGCLAIYSTEDGAVRRRVQTKNPYKVFVHPSGAYVVVSATDGEIYAISTSSSRLFASVPLRPVNAVETWRHDAQATSACFATSISFLRVGESIFLDERGLTDKSTLSDGVEMICLVGANAGGLLFSLHVSRVQSRLQMTVELVWTVPDPVAASLPISSAFFERIDSGGGILCVSTATHLFRVASSDSATPLASLLGGVAAGTTKLQVRVVPLYDMASVAASEIGKMEVFRPRRSDSAQFYLWNSAGGVVHGLFFRDVTTDMESGNEAMLFRDAAVEVPAPPIGVNEQEVEPAVLRFAKKAQENDREVQVSVFAAAPSASSLIQVLPLAFHMILLYERRCIVLHQPPGVGWRPTSDVTGSEISPISPSEVQSRVRFDPFRLSPPQHAFRGIVRDVTSRKVYLFNRGEVWQIGIEEEHHQQWATLLQHAMHEQVSFALRKRFFDAAVKLSCYTAAQRSLCEVCRGKFFLDCGALQHATTVLAACDWFEAIYTMLTTYRNPQVVMMYAEKRLMYLLDHVSDRSGYGAQCAVLVALVVMGKLQRVSSCASASPAAGAAAEEDLNAFVRVVVAQCGELFQDTAVYNVLARMLEEQGCHKTALFLAKAMQQMRYVVASHISQENYLEATKVLGTCHNTPAQLRLWYEFTPALIEHCPVALVTALLRLFGREFQQRGVLPLSIERLIPSFIRYRVEMNEVEGNNEHQVVILLEQCIHHCNCVSSAIHNYYVELLVATRDEERLDDFINSSVFFDVGYALRICLKQGCVAACVSLYKRLLLYRDAVQTALSTSISDDDGGVGWPGLATAEDILRGLAGKVSKDDLKQLWLLAAQYAIKARSGSAAPLAIINESGGLLRLEDVLSCVDDRAVVSDFRDAICVCLDDYAVQKKAQGQKQDEAFRTAEGVKQDLQETRQQYGYITPSQRCPLCGKRLLQNSMPSIIYPNCGHVVHEECAVHYIEEAGGLELFFTDEDISPHVVEGVTGVRQLVQQDCVVCGEALVVQIDQPLQTDYFSWNVL